MLLRLLEKNLLVVPAVRTKHGEAAFSWYAAQLWNQLPDDIKGAPIVVSFKARLNTQLFSDAFGELTKYTLLFIYLTVIMHFNSGIRPIVFPDKEVTSWVYG